MLTPAHASITLTFLTTLTIVLPSCGASPARETTTTTTTTTTGVVVVEVGGSGGTLAPPPPPPARPREEPMQVQWSNVSSSGGCFFFSGPDGLGRDDLLGTRATYLDGGQMARLWFDPRVVFEGYLATVPFTLVRTSVHEYSGRWSVRETFALEALPGGVFRGRYHYDELDPSGNPTGHCNIDALVTMSPY